MRPNLEPARKNKNTKALTTFFALVILLSAVVEALICSGGSQWLYLALMWIPALAALTASCGSFLENGEPFSLKGLLAKGGFRTCRLRYILLGCLLPLLIGGDYIQRDRRVHDPLRMGIGCNPVHAGEEAIE